MESSCPGARHIVSIQCMLNAATTATTPAAAAATTVYQLRAPAASQWEGDRSSTVLPVGCLGHLQEALLFVPPAERTHLEPGQLTQPHHPVTPLPSRVKGEGPLAPPGRWTSPLTLCWGLLLERERWPPNLSSLPAADFPQREIIWVNLKMEDRFRVLCLTETVCQDSLALNRIRLCLGPTEGKGSTMQCGVFST